MAATVEPGMSSSLRPVVELDISSPEPPRFEARGARTGSRDHSDRGLQATRTKLDRETIFQCLPVQLAPGSLLWPLLQQDPSWLRCSWTLWSGKQGQREATGCEQAPG